MDVIFLVYGLSFLAMGLAIVIHLDRESHLALANILWLLAAFGFSHGLLEWTDLWSIVRGDNPGLATIRPAILLISYLFLFEFGRRLALLSLSAAAQARPASRLLSAWIYAPLLGGIMAGTAVSNQPAVAMVIWSRYLAGFLGSGLVGMGFHFHWRNRLEPIMPTSVHRTVRIGSELAAAAFIAYAILGGLVVPRADWFPASVINQEDFLAIFHVPVQLLRATCAVLATVGVIVLVRIFYFEAAQRLRSALIETKQAQETLRESEGGLRAIFAGTLDGIVVADLETRKIANANAAFCKMLGYTHDEILCMSISDIHPKPDVPQVIEGFERDVRGETEKGENIPVLRKDGSVFYADITGATIRFGGRDCLLGVFRDITERKRTEEALRASEERFKRIFEEAPLGIALIGSLTGHIYSVNPMFAKIAGRTMEEMTHIDWMSITHPDDVQEDLDNMALLNAGKIPGFQMEKRYLRRDGTPVWINMTIAPIYVEDKAHPRHLCMIEDITERKQSAKVLRDSATQTRVFAENIPAMAISFDANLRCLLINKHYADFFGLSAETAVGKHLREVVGDEAYSEIEGHFAQVLRGHPVTYERIRKLPNGEARHIEVTVLPQAGEREEVSGCLALVTDITEHKLAEQRIQSVAHHDNLTGLPNRLLFNDRLSQTMAAGKRSGCHSALMFLDLDNFKPLNDTHGHAAGDLLLSEAADRLRNCVRETDTVARFGGDEFVVMIGELSVDKSDSNTQAAIIAEKIRAALAKPYALKIQREGGMRTTVNHQCTASIGVALFGKDDVSQKEILKCADTAMYQAKEAGRNVIRFSDANA